MDDGLIVGTDEKDVSNFVDVLKREFKITEYKAECFLGLQIVRQEDGSLFIHQTAYIKKLLKKFNMMEANCVATPIETARYGNSEASAPVNVPYREAIGGLLYLKTGTRPDIAFSVSVLSEKVENPKEKDWVAVKRVFRYLKGSVGMGLLYKFSCEDTNLSTVKVRYFMHVRWRRRHLV